MQMAEIIEFPTDLNISNRLNLFEIMNESVIFKFWKKTDSERIRKKIWKTIDTAHSMNSNRKRELLFYNTEIMNSTFWEYPKTKETNWLIKS